MNSDKKGGLSSMKEIMSLYKVDETKQKRISREFQDYAYRLAVELEDLAHRAIYMRMAKTMDRSILEQARGFVKDSNASNKGALFMWKVKEIKKARALKK